MLSFGACGLLVIGIVNTPIFALDLVMMGIIGAGIVWAMVTSQTLMQKTTSDSHRGRVFGSYNMVLSLMVLIGMGIASACSGLLSTAILFDIAGLFFALSALMFVRIPVVNMAAVLSPAES